MDVQGQSYNIQNIHSHPPTAGRPSRVAPTRADALAGKTVDLIKQSSDTTNASAAKAAHAFTISEKDLQDLDMMAKAMEELQKSFEEEPSGISKQSPESLPEEAKARRQAPKRSAAPPHSKPELPKEAAVTSKDTKLQDSGLPIPPAMPSADEIAAKELQDAWDAEPGIDPEVKVEDRTDSLKASTLFRSTPTSAVRGGLTTAQIISKSRAATETTLAAVRARSSSIRERAHTALESLKRAFSPDKVRARNATIREAFSSGVRKVKELFIRKRASIAPQARSAVLQVSTSLPKMAENKPVQSSSPNDIKLKSGKTITNRREAPQRATTKETLAKVKMLEKTAFENLSETDAKLVANTLEKEFGNLSAELTSIDSFNRVDDEHSTKLEEGKLDEVIKKQSFIEKVEAKIKNLKTTFKNFHESNIERRRSANLKVLQSFKNTFRTRANTN